MNKKEEEFCQFLSELREIEAKKRAQKHQELKEQFNPVRDFTVEQLDVLLRWGDTLHFYRQLPITSQEIAKPVLASHEQLVERTLGTITNLKAVRNLSQGNPLNKRSGIFAQGSLLCWESVLKDGYYTPDIHYDIPRKRFGYEFYLNHSGQYYWLITFFRGAKPFTKAGIEIIERIKRHNLEPTSIMDLPKHRNFHPFSMSP